MLFRKTIIFNDQTLTDELADWQFLCSRRRLQPLLTSVIQARENNPDSLLIFEALTKKAEKTFEDIVILTIFEVIRTESFKYGPFIEALSKKAQDAEVEQQDHLTAAELRKVLGYFEKQHKHFFSTVHHFRIASKNFAAIGLFDEAAEMSWQCWELADCLDNEWSKVANLLYALKFYDLDQNHEKAFLVADILKDHLPYVNEVDYLLEKLIKISNNLQAFNQLSLAADFSRLVGDIYSNLQTNKTYLKKHYQPEKSENRLHDLWTITKVILNKNTRYIDYKYRSQKQKLQKNAATSYFVAAKQYQNFITLEEILKLFGKNKIWMNYFKPLGKFNLIIAKPLTAIMYLSAKEITDPYLLIRFQELLMNTFNNKPLEEWCLAAEMSRKAAGLARTRGALNIADEFNAHAANFFMNGQEYKQAELLLYERASYHTQENNLAGAVSVYKKLKYLYQNHLTNWEAEEKVKKIIIDLLAKIEKTPRIPQEAQRHTRQQVAANN